MSAPLWTCGNRAVFAEQVQASSFSARVYKYHVKEFIKGAERFVTSRETLDEAIFAALSVK